MEQRKLYISDLHLFHTNVTQAGKNFDNRPYKDVEEMNADLLKRWNENVGNSDHVYICGDMVWKFNENTKEACMNILNKMNGNMHLITGNHDIINSSVFKKRFDEITGYKKIKDKLNDKDVQVVMSHYYMPFYEGHYYGGVLIHGHSHVTEESVIERKMTKWLNENNFPITAYNVGCMYPYMDYAPKTLQQIHDGYNKWIGEGNGF